jgi:Fur family peroxide stress response transcriptional regulator
MNVAAPPTSRPSRQRELVFEIVASTHSHPTADWIYEEARRRLPRVSLGTVYRNLQVLEREGRIRAIDSWGKSTRYDADLSPHYHFLCDGCGGISDMERPEASEEKVAPLMRKPGFLVTGHRLEFHGLCPDCGKRKKPSTRHA